MATLAISAFGTLVKIGDGGSPENFTTVAELAKIDGPNMQANTIDVTVHNSGSPWRRFISGLIDGGELKLTINFVPQNATHNYSAGLLSDFVNRAKRNFQLVFPEGTTWLLPTIITSFQTTSDPAGALTASVALKINGTPTLA